MSLGNCQLCRFGNFPRHFSHAQNFFTGHTNHWGGAYAGREPPVWHLCPSLFLLMIQWPESGSKVQLIKPTTPFRRWRGTKFSFILAKFVRLRIVLEVWIFLLSEIFMPRDPVDILFGVSKFKISLEGPPNLATIKSTSVRGVDSYTSQTYFAKLKVDNSFIFRIFSKYAILSTACSEAW